jgi:hypothetical protein
MRAPITQCFATRLIFEPGSGSAYGGGLDLVGLTIGGANDCTLEAYMRWDIFDVLGTDSTFFCIKHHNVERKVCQ